MESNEDRQQPGTAAAAGITGTGNGNGSGYQTALTVPPLQRAKLVENAAADEEYGYNEKPGAGEQAPLLGTGSAGRGRLMPRKQCIWNIVMALALVATIVLIILLVLLSSNAAKEDEDGGDQNSTVLEDAGTRFELPFRMLQATGDGVNGTNAGGTGVEDPGAAPAPDPPVVVPTPRNDTSLNTTLSTPTSALINVTTPSPSVTNVTSASTTTIAPTTTPEPPLDTSIQVQIDQGLLQGVRRNTSTGREYLAFLGVPYAQAPVGNLRFKEPVEAEIWNGTYNATKYTAGCVGAATGISLSEDCLYLNVYTPKNSSEIGTSAGRGGFGGGGGGGVFGGRGRQNQLPVIVYLTGDGDGGAETNAVVDHFMGQNVTLVTLNYRVGIFGTLNLNTSNAAGNQGLKDQVMALKWVKDNIREFGGNQRKLTLFGAPGIASAHVTAHLLSPANDNVIKRVVVNSGSVLQQGYFTPLDDALLQAAKIGASLNCSTNVITVAVTEQLATCFLNKTTAELVTAATGAAYNVRLTIDAAAGDANGDGDNANGNGDGDDDGAFFLDTPAKLLQNGTFAQQKIPAIVGTSSGRSVVDGQPKWNVRVIEDEQGNSTQLTIALDELTSFIKLPSQNTNDTNRVILNQIQDFYFNQSTNGNANANSTGNGTGNATRTVDIGDPSVLKNVTHLYADRMLNHPAVAFAHGLYLANNGSGAGGGGIFGNLFGRGQGSGEVYLFHQNATVLEPETEGLFSSVFMQLWTTFADTGVPAGTDAATGQNVTWTPINNQTKPYQALWVNHAAGNGTVNGNGTLAATNSSSSFSNSSSYSFQMGDFFGDRMQFWDTFGLTDIYQ